MTLKDVPKADCDPKKFSKVTMNVHWRKLTNEKQGKPEHDAAFGTIIRIAVFIQASINITFIFLFNKAD